MKGKPAKHILAALAGAALLLGCTREAEPLAPVVLTAVLEQTDTRTSYDGVQGKLTWTEGDEVAVHVGNSYQTAEITPSDGHLAVSETASAYRNHYAVYPASAADAANYGNSTLKVNLPASYDISDIVSGASATRTADFSPCPMVAVNDTDDSILRFHHVGGLLRITLTGVKAATKTVTVTFDKDVTGSYAVSDPATDHPTITTGETATNNVVTFTVASSSVGSTSVPIVLNVPVPCGTYNSVTVEMLDSDGAGLGSSSYDEQALVFARHHGKKLEFGEYTMSVTDALGAAVSMLTYDGTGAATDAQAFTVTHARSIGSTASPLAWKTQIYDETANAWVDLEGNCPDWLENFPLNSTGATTADGTISDTPAPAHTYRVNVGEQPVTSHEDMLKSAPALGNESAPLDLSKWNFVTKQTEPRYTANCYVVQAPGWYCFPLVYGNGIENNVVARASYEGKTLQAGHLDEFKKKDDFSIYAAPDAPWLQDDLFTDYHHGVRLQWQKYSYWDESSQTVVTAGNNYNNEYDVASDTPQTVANPQQVIKNLAVYQGTDGWYIKFYVDPETIRPGNALIASLDRDNDICWSWHIWITDQDMSPVTVGSNQVLPVNLGWVDLEKGLFYAERSRKLKFVSTEKEGVESDEITVIQSEYEKESTTGWQTYYQWGRKDPLAEKLTRVYDDDGLLKEAIKHPNNIQYDAGHKSGVTYYDWTSANYNNLWDSKWTDYGVSSSNLPVHKTVYDPSPRKFCVSPEIWAFGSLGHEGAFDNGYYFHTSGASDETLFFPASGYMDFMDAQIKSEGTEGRYWTTHAAAGTQQRESYCLKFTGTTVNDVYSALMHRSYGYSVRPVSFNLIAPAPSETAKRKEVAFGTFWSSDQISLNNKSITVVDDSNHTLFTISFKNLGVFNPPQYKAAGQYVELDQHNSMTVTASSAVKTISSIGFAIQKAGNTTITTDPSDTFSNGVWLNETGTDVSAVSFTTGDRFIAIEWELTGLIITYEIP